MSNQEIECWIEKTYWEENAAKKYARKLPKGTSISIYYCVKHKGWHMIERKSL